MSNYITTQQIKNYIGHDLRIQDYSDAISNELANHSWKAPLTQIIPILTPISDLNKEIEIGKKFLPIDFIKNRCSSESEFKNLLAIIDRNRFKELPYWLLSHLFEWHFDVFGLIEKGLAIDINTLKP